MKKAKINPFDKLRINGERSRTIKSIKSKPHSKISLLRGREIFDSRGNPTVGVSLATNNGVFIDFVPSGASRGKNEAIELRDGGKRYKGRGVLKAVNNINKIIAPKLIGKDPINQKEIDGLMIKLDGTKNKSKLGANAILAVSMAVCRAGAKAENMSLFKYIAQLAGNSSPLILPKPCFNIINGGAHSKNNLDVQEFMIVPQENNFSKNLKIAKEIYREIKKIIKKEYGKSGVKLGDEGGFSPPLKTTEETIILILAAIRNLGYSKKIKIILDVAASQFFKRGRYKMDRKNFSNKELVKYYLGLTQKYPILGLEDPFSENDLKGWRMLSSKFQTSSSKFLIIGDDLTVTNPERIKLAYKKKACNGIIIKTNQIGTVSETIEAVKLAKTYGWKIIVSHRSGETLDDFIADLAVGVGAGYIKSGAPFLKERMAKYNRLVRIERGLI